MLLQNKSQQKSPPANLLKKIFCAGEIKKKIQDPKKPGEKFSKPKKIRLCRIQCKNLPYAMMKAARTFYVPVRLTGYREL